MELLGERIEKFTDPVSEKVGRNFNPRDSDIFIATFPKCGTTWVTQILHGLRSKGDMNFKEITEVVPWDVMALNCGQNVDDDQKFTPRLFKSHETFIDIAKNEKSMCKYVHVARNPLDAFLSMYNFGPAFFCVPQSEIPQEVFAEVMIGPDSRGTISQFYCTFLEAIKKHPDNVYWIFFEDLKEDLPKCIDDLAAWLNLTPEDEELRQVVIDQSSFKFMKAHVNQFDDNFVFDHVKEQVGLGHVDRIQTSKVNKGANSKGKGICNKAKELMALDWEKHVKSQYGYQDYEAMKKAVKEMQATRSKC